MKLNKKQKRTATIASMAALLAVVLGMGGQTFAKYIETHTIKADNAVVAKFGFNLQIQTEGDTLFSKEYNGGAIASTNKVVAPGASGEIKYVLNGVSEVDAVVTVSFEGYTPVYLKKGDTAYNPIEWKVDGGTAKSTPEGFTYNFAAGSEEVDKVITVSWAWPFDANEAVVAAPSIDGLDRDKLDTIFIRRNEIKEKLNMIRHDKTSKVDFYC